MVANTFSMCLLLSVCLSFCLSGRIAEGKTGVSDVSVQFKPEILEPLLWPWRSELHSAGIPTKSLNVTTWKSDSETSHTKPSSHPRNTTSHVIYSDGELAENWQDSSWNTIRDWASPCPESASVNVTSEHVLQHLVRPLCLEATVKKNGGLSFSLKNEREDKLGDGSLVLWILIPADGLEHDGEGMHESDHHFDLCRSNASTIDSTICPAVRLLAGPVGEDPLAKSPLQVFLHAGGLGSHIFSVPLLQLTSDFKPGDWNKIVIPLGTSGWGGDNEWNRVSLISNNSTRFYVGEMSIQEEQPKAILSQSELGKEVAVIDESQAKRLEEVGVQQKDVHDKEAKRSSKTSAEGGPEKPQQLIRYLFEDSMVPHGVSDWSWLSNVTLDNESGLCAKLESHGGLSLKANQAFAKASVIKFRIKTSNRFYINRDGKVKPALNMRLDATKEKYNSEQKTDLGNAARPEWLTFYTSELIPLQSAVPSLVSLKSASWMDGVLPLTGFGDHAWDRISFIDATGDGTDLCIDNVTVEYTVTVDQSAPFPSLGEELTDALEKDQGEFIRPDGHVHKIPSLGEELADAMEKRRGEYTSSGLDGNLVEEDVAFDILMNLCSNSSDVSCTIEEFNKLKKRLTPNRNTVREFSFDNHPVGYNPVKVNPPQPEEKELHQNTTVMILLAVVSALFCCSALALVFVLVSYKIKKDNGLLRFWGRLTPDKESPVDSIESIQSACDGPERIRFSEVECNYDYSHAIGVGSTCAVFKGKWRGQDVAIKAIHWKGEGSKPPPGEVAICREMECLPSVRSPFVIKMKAFAHAHDTTYLILEYCKHGNLQSLMKKGAIKLDKVRALKLLRHICLGLQHLNEAGMAHRDVKSSNILIQCSHCKHSNDEECLEGLESNLVAKLGDLGVSKSYGTLHQTHLETFCGTPRWMAPERLALQTSLSCSSDRQHSLSRCVSQSAAKCDVYSFGILAWEIINYQTTNKYELPFDEYIPQQKGLGMFIDGEYDSMNDGTFFNSSSFQSGTVARHNTFSSDNTTGYERSDTGFDASTSEISFHEGVPRKSNIWNPSFESSLYRKIIMGQRPTIPDDCSVSVADLIRECWRGEVNQRPSFHQISSKLDLLIQLE